MNKITDDAAMVAAIEQAGFIVTRASGETSALVEHPTRNAEGERLTVCMSHCTDPGGAQSLPTLWHKNGDTSTRLDTYWFIHPVVFDSVTSECHKYDPQTRGRELDFAWVLEATPENLYKLLTETRRRFLTCEK